MIRAVMAPPSPPWDSVLIGTRRLPNCDCTTNTASTKLAASDAGSHHRWKRGARSRRAAARMRPSVVSGGPPSASSRSLCQGSRGNGVVSSFSSMSSVRCDFAERLLELRHRVAQPALRGLRVHAGGLADLGHREPALDVEQERVALFLRQVRERRGQPLASLALEHLLERFRRCVARRSEHRLVVRRLARCAPAAAPPVVHAAVVRDPVQPGRETRLGPVALAMRDHARPALLEDVVRSRRVRHRTADETPYRRPVPVVEGIKRPRIARGVTQHELRVGVAISHRSQLYPEGAGASLKNAPGAAKGFGICARDGPREGPSAPPLGRIEALWLHNLLILIGTPDHSRSLLKKCLLRSQCYSSLQHQTSTSVHRIRRESCSRWLKKALGRPSAPWPPLRSCRAAGW